jgi:hypothetical protein
VVGKLYGVFGRQSNHLHIEQQISNVGLQISY